MSGAETALAIPIIQGTGAGAGATAGVAGVGGAGAATGTAVSGGALGASAGGFTVVSAGTAGLAPAAGTGIAAAAPAGLTAAQTASLVLAGGSLVAGGVQTGLSIQEARERAKAIEEAQLDASEAAEQRRSSEFAVAAARRRTINRARQRAEAEARVQSSAAGLADDRSVLGRLQNINVDAGLALNNLNQDVGVRVANTLQTRDAQIRSLQNQRPNLTTVGVSSALSGLQTGIGLMQLGQSIDRLLNPPPSQFEIPNEFLT
jgi:hypothetical protein